MRERLLEIVKEGRDPDRRVLGVAPAFTRQPAGHFKVFTLVVGSVVAFGCLRELLGRGTSEPFVYLILSGGLALAFGSLATIVGQKRWPPPPWRQGLWALPGSVVDLNAGWMDVIPTAELGTPTIVTRMEQGKRGSSTLTLGPGLGFYFRTEDAAKQACTDFLRVREQIAEAVVAGSASKLKELDPFAECTLAHKWSWPGEGGTQVAARPAWFPRARWVGSLVLALLISAGISLALKAL